MGLASGLSDDLGRDDPAVALPDPRVRPETGTVRARWGAGGDPDGPPARDDARRARGVRLIAGRGGTSAVERAWHAPDPIAPAHPLADLRDLFGRLRDGGCRIAVATSDDREPTERTLPPWAWQTASTRRLRR